MIVFFIGKSTPDTCFFEQLNVNQVEFRKINGGNTQSNKLKQGSKDETSIVFDSKTLQEFSEIAKLWTENQLKINFQKLSARNKKTTVSSRRKNPRVRNNRVSGTGYANETIDNKDYKFWTYMDRIFCSRNNIPYSLIDATPRYQRRGARERSKPYPPGIFYIK
ncbi:MAG: hypothetical protein E7050_11760 [Lentisphaerae bacterium]|nr:hypothetical protein [Lentisphaerota bacterium]